LETIFEGCWSPVNLRRRFRNTAPKGRCISEKLEKIDGKRRPQPKKFVSKSVRRGFLDSRQKHSGMTTSLVVLLEILRFAQDDNKLDGFPLSRE